MQLMKGNNEDSSTALTTEILLQCNYYQLNWTCWVKIICLNTVTLLVQIDMVFQSLMLPFISAHPSNTQFIPNILQKNIVFENNEIPPH